jgi:hypothetical protein
MGSQRADQVLTQTAAREGKANRWSSPLPLSTRGGMLGEVGGCVDPRPAWRRTAPQATRLLASSPAQMRRTQLREYAFEQLQQSGELNDLKCLHHQWFADLLDAEADAHADKLIGSATEGQPWLPESSIRGQEIENIRAAVAWAVKKQRWHGWKQG